MNATMLPSAARLSHERRVRAFRRLLDEHRPVREPGLEQRVGRCECGVRIPRHVPVGEVAHRDHLADVLAAES